MKNKKGSTTDFIADFFAYVLFVIIFLLFFILFSISLGGCDGRPIKVEMVSKANNDLSGEMLLLNFLKTEVDIEGGKISMSELIARSYLQEDYTILEEKTNDVLDNIDQNIFGESKCFYLCVDINHERVKIIKSSGCQIFAWGLSPFCQNTKVTIPLIYSNPAETAVVSLSHEAYMNIGDN